MKPPSRIAPAMETIPPRRPWPLRLGEARPATLARTESYHLITDGGRTYVARVALPAEPAPPRGFPVVYLLDGGACFGTMAEAVRMQSRRPSTTGVDPAIVIGIGYDTDEVFDIEQRLLDLTPSTALDFPESGGADAFLEFLAADLMPAFEGRLRIDPERRLLFGHSLGGLFALHALFTRPDLFSAVAAASPSLWWNGGDTDAEKLFVGRKDRFMRDTRLMICVGELERALPPGLVKLQPGARERHMVERARDLAARLHALEDPHLEVSFIEFAGENHASVVPSAISRSLRLLRRFPSGEEGDRLA
ncbi:Ferri-bacillibactin esterase BesA [Labrys miyagiensis]